MPESSVWKNTKTEPGVSFGRWCPSFCKRRRAWLPRVMTRRETSAGCVVYRMENGLPEVALIQPHDRKAWALPKGLIERGEPPEKAAERERSEEHTSKLQSLAYLVCRLLLEKKKNEIKDQL